MHASVIFVVYSVLFIPCCIKMECAGKWMHVDGFANGGSGCVQVFVMVLAAVTTHRNRESVLGAQSSSITKLNQYRVVLTAYSGVLDAYVDAN